MTFLRTPNGWHLESMSPASFGLVMATGIISIAAHLLGCSRLAHLLFDLNIAFFIILWVLTFWRMLRYPTPFFRDLGDHLRGPGFFTMVAAASILGGQFVLLDGNLRAGAWLWTLTGVLWVILTYAIFATLTIRTDKPPLERGLSGSWLLAVVATQAITVLGGMLAGPGGPLASPAMDLLILAMWLAGGVLYVYIMTLIFFRYLFLSFAPEDLSPSYWINMGGMAISTLAGTQLITLALDSTLLLSILPFIKGLTLLFWAAGTWWIPLLLVLEIWRHVVKRYPIHYDPLYWGLAFPLGMYAASTHALIQVLDLGFLSEVPRVFLYAALVVWAIAFAGLVHDVWRRWAGARQTV